MPHSFMNAGYVEARGCMRGIVTQKLGDVESDAARADDRNGTADGPAMQQHVDVS